MTEKLVNLEGVELKEFLGAGNVNLETLRRGCPQVHILSRGNWIKGSGESSSVADFDAKVASMLEYYREHNVLPPDIVEDIVGGKRVVVTREEASVVVYTVDGRPVKARGLNQQKMVEAMGRDDMLFAIGPAGAGKTYLAIALAVHALKTRQVRKIVLSRPAVEAGEKLGFLPGDMKDKIDPYLQPLYDALEDMIPQAKLKEYLENKVIQCFRYSGRGSEHDVASDQDVLDANGPQRQVRHHGRPFAGGSSVVGAERTSLRKPYLGQGQGHQRDPF